MHSLHIHTHIYYIYVNIMAPNYDKIMKGKCNLFACIKDIVHVMRGQGRFVVPIRAKDRAKYKTVSNINIITKWPVIRVLTIPK
jgi:hypothetical protein